MLLHSKTADDLIRHFTADESIFGIYRTMTVSNGTYVIVPFYMQISSTVKKNGIEEMEFPIT